MKCTIRDAIDILYAVQSDAVFMGGLYTQEFLRNVDNMLKMTLAEREELKQKMREELNAKYSLNSLDLPEKIKYTLIMHDINDCTKLCDYSAEELLKKRGLGLKSVQTIEEKLKEKGLFLKGHWREF